MNKTKKVLSLKKQTEVINEFARIINVRDTEFNSDETEVPYCCGLYEIGGVIDDEVLTDSIESEIDDWKNDYYNEDTNSVFLTTSKVREALRVKYLSELFTKGFLRPVKTNYTTRFMPRLVCLLEKDQSFALSILKEAAKRKTHKWQFTPTISGSTGNKIVIILITAL